MKSLKCVSHPLNHRSQVMFCLAHHRTQLIVFLFSTLKQKTFFQFVIDTLSYPNASCDTYEHFQQEHSMVQNQILILMDIPTDFQEMKNILNISKEAIESILMVPSIFKKYINLLKKKVAGMEIEIVQTEYSPSKFVGINDKLKGFVDSNYDMNRGAFYAYGSYLNTIHKNPFKKIFRTELINVDQLSKSYGYGTAPKVNTGKFLKEHIRKKLTLERRRKKRQMKKKRKEEKKSKMEESEVKKVKKVKKIKKGI